MEGYDACRKIAILSSLMFSKNVDSEKVPTEGITKITAADFEYANATDHTIKLLGRSRAIDDNTAEVMVAPFYFPKNIRLPWYMVYSMLYLSPATCWEIPCITDGAQVSFPPPAR